MDSCQVLLVPVFHVFHSSILHILRDDGGGPDSELQCLLCCFHGILCHLEPVLRIFNTKNCKYSNSFRGLLVWLLTNLCSYFSLYANSSLPKMATPPYREFQFGGDGSTGFAPLHGHSTDWSLHNLEM